MTYHGKYDSPAELLRDESLSYHEKIKLLESWRDDKDAYLRASDEGMPGNVQSDLLRQIEEALSTLQENPPR